MTSKKGIVATIGILVVITIASFVIWAIPDNRLVFVVTDYEGHLDGVKEKHQILIQETEKELQRLINKEIDSEEYTNTAQISSSQINELIIELVEAEIDTKWQNSYTTYIQSLQNWNSYMRESIVLASQLNQNITSEEINNTREKMVEFESSMMSLIKESNDARP